MKILLKVLLVFALAGGVARADVPLLHAIESGNQGKAIGLIQGGADVNAKDNELGGSPLAWAALDNYVNVANSLINKGADVNAKDSGGNTPLHWTVWGNAIDVANLLISKGADVNAKDQYGNTPLCIAKLKGDSKMATALKAAGGIIGRGAPPPDGAQDARRKWKKCEK